MAKKVLIVEDDSNISELLRLYLEKDGFQVIQAADGGEGLRMAQSESRAGRLGSLLRGTQNLQRAHHHAHRQGRDL